MSYPTSLPPLDLDLDLEALERAVAPTPRERLMQARDRLLGWCRRHRVDALLVLALIAISGIVHARGMYTSPARFDDEGTYTAYAWSVEYWHRLAHYTYWYAHPPLGQLQMGLWDALTGAFDRLPFAVATGREFALVCKLVSVALLYGLGRRLGMRRTTSVFAVALFSLSPLAVYFERTALLDNVVTPWLLAAFFFAASGRRSVWAATGCAVAFAMAVLTKETALLFMPALLLLFWQHSDRRNRRFTGMTLMAVMALIGLSYPLYAAIKNELLAGEGHVSLVGAIQWQLFGRTGSGSVFNADSTAHHVVVTWLNLDSKLCIAAVVALVPGLLLRRTRAVALGLGIQLASLLRNGYLPYPFVIAMIPFAALTIAGVTDQLWTSFAGAVREARTTRGVPLARIALRGTTSTLALVLIAAFMSTAVKPWRYGIEDLWHHDRDAGKRAALAWLKENANHGDVLVVNDAFWVDLVREGHRPGDVIWFTKLDVDPAVALSGRQAWRAIDYVVLDHQDSLSVHLNRDGSPSPDTLALYPTLGRAIAHSTVVARFGQRGDRVAIRRVGAPASAALSGGRG